MAENAFALTADGIELNEFGKLDKEDWDWGHLQPGQFRFCFLPRTPLRRPGDGEDSSDLFSVFRRHDGPDGPHRRGRLARGRWRPWVRLPGVVGHAAYDASAKVGRAMANDLFGDDADAVVHKVEESIEDAERGTQKKMAEAAAALHAAEEKASAVLHAGEDLAKKVGGEALHAVGDVGGKALHAVDDAAHAVGAEVMKDLGKVGDVVGGIGTGVFNKAKGLGGRCRWRGAQARHGRGPRKIQGPGGSATRYGHQRRRLDLHETLQLTRESPRPRTKNLRRRRSAGPGSGARLATLHVRIETGHRRQAQTSQFPLPFFQRESGIDARRR